MNRFRPLPVAALLACCALAAAPPDPYDPNNPVAPASYDTNGPSRADWLYYGQLAVVTVDGAIYEPPAGATYTPAVGWSTGRPWRYVGHYPAVQVLIDWGDFSRLQEYRAPVAPPWGYHAWHRYPATGTYHTRTLVLDHGTQVAAIDFPVVVKEPGQ